MTVEEEMLDNLELRKRSRITQDLLISVTVGVTLTSTPE